ncbi:MAG: response regulator [Bacteriovoracaceae bacterium]|nr:response regulator [Bacteriovoracaceae bacterium]
MSLNKKEIVKILMIDDSFEDKRSYRELLENSRNNYEFYGAENSKEVFEILSNNTPDCLLVNYNLLQGDGGTKIFRELNSNEEFQSIPVIFLTDDDNENIELEAISNGAQDYHVKNEITSMELSRSIFSSIERKMMEMECKKAKHDVDVANMAKSEFLSNMGHNIRTPMNSIIGFTDLLIGEKLGGKARQYVEMIRDSSENLLALINDILDFSKIEAGRLELEKRTIDLRKLLNASIHATDNLISRKKLSVDCFFARDVPVYIKSDPMRLQQILINLITNAAKFTEHGKISISIDVKKNEEKVFELCFEIKDTGIGIPEKKIKNLFDPFCQVDSSRTRKYSGTGLGLAICKNLCGLLRGRIWVESMVGEGSAFNFTIMAETVDEDEIKEIEKVNEYTSGEAKSLPPLKILIAEDNVANQAVVKGHLLKLGCESDIAENGLKVMEALERKLYDVILMDIQMPEMDGFETTKMVCMKYTRDNRPRIIGLTASVMGEDRKKCFDAGMDDYLSKPVRSGDLVNALKKCNSEACGVFVTAESHDKNIKCLMVLDEKVLLEEYDEMLDVLSNGINLFLKEYTKMMDEIKVALDKEDGKALEISAHALKGILKNFYAYKASEDAYKLEKLGEVGGEDFKNASKFYKNLDESMKELVQKLVQLLKNIKI